MPALSIRQAFELAIQHHQAGRPAEAEAIYRQILSVQPANALAYANLGEACYALGRTDEALTCFHRAIELSPNFGEAHVSLGNALRVMGQLDAAIAAYRRASECKPGYAEALSNLGGALTQRGQLDEAVAVYRRALELRPDLAIIWNNLANTLCDQKKFSEAEAASRQAVALNPNLPEGHYNLGNTLLEQGKAEEAAAAYGRALALQPNYAEAHNNLGVVLTELGRLDEAEAACRRAIQLKASFPAAHNNLGNVFTEMRRLDEAGTEYRRSLELDPDYAQAGFGLALLHLSRGDFERGWPLYESRWEAWQVSRRQFSQPVWDGRPLHGQRVLVDSEQGYGDAIQFIRYASLIAARGGEVVVQCPRVLVELFRSGKGVGEVVAVRDPLPAFDWHLPMASQPLVFQTNRETIPRETPYLFADSERREIWRTRLDRSRPRVGLAWAGSARYRRDRVRSIPFPMLLPLLQMEGVDFYSLQVTEGAGPVPTLPGARAIIDHTHHFADFADTAALISELDLVISADTAVAHLAGALGRPVWTLTSFAPDWRWGLDGEETPWYPTMRLFRQPALGDWPSVLDRVAAELKRAIIANHF